MQLYLTVRPEDTRTASAYPAGLAHAAYRIGEGSSLLSRNLLTPARSGPMAPLPGLLVLSDRSAPSMTARRHWPRPCSGNAPAAAMAESFWILTSRPGRIAAALLPYWGSSAPKAESSSAFPRPTPGRRSIPPLL